MPGLTSTLDIARRALMAHQSVMSVIGHNIANAGVAGYTRQVAHLTTETPQQWGGRSWGTGVTLATITQRRSLFLDRRLRSELSSLGGWGTRARVLGQVEGLFNETGETGFSASLDAYFSAWSDLSTQPEDMALRSQVVTQGQLLAERLNRIDASLTEIAGGLEAQIDLELADFNHKLAQIEDLSSQISASNLEAGEANDLVDRRNALLDELSQIADVQWSDLSGSGFTVRVSGRLVLDASGARPLSRQTLREGLSGGSLGALMELRDETLPGLRSRLDTLASDLIQQVNALHRAGPSQVDFFSGSDAGDIAVNATLVHDLGALNVSSSGIAGENDIALAIAQLRDARVIDELGMTPDEFWSAFVGQVGMLSAEAIAQTENSEWSVAAAENARAAETGVSIDEELTQMISTQNAYLAAARVLDTASQMMDALLAI